MTVSFAAGSNSIITPTATPVTAAPFTMSIWFRATTNMAVGGDYAICQMGDTGTAVNYWKLSSGSGDFRFAGTVRDESDFDNFGTTVLTINTWYNGIFRETTSSSREIFLDGVSAGTESSVRTPAGVDAWALGRENDSSQDDSWTGQLDHFALWDLALTDAECLALGRGTNPMTIRPASLVEYVTTDNTSRVTSWINNGYSFTLTAITAYTGPAPPVAPMPGPIVANFTPAAVGVATVDNLFINQAVNRAATY